MEEIKLLKLKHFYLWYCFWNSFIKR